MKTNETVRQVSGRVCQREEPWAREGDEVGRSYPAYAPPGGFLKGFAFPQVRKKAEAERRTSLPITPVKAPRFPWGKVLDVVGGLAMYPGMALRKGRSSTA